MSEVTALKDTLTAVSTKIDKIESQQTNQNILKNLEAISKAVKAHEEKAEGEEKEGENKKDVSDDEWST